MCSFFLQLSWGVASLCLVDYVGHEKARAVPGEER